MIDAMPEPDEEPELDTATDDETLVLYHERKFLRDTVKCIKQHGVMPRFVHGKTKFGGNPMTIPRFLRGYLAGLRWRFYGFRHAEVMSEHDRHELMAYAHELLEP